MNRLTKCLMSHEGALFPREVHPIQGPLLFSMQPRRERGSLLQSSEMSGAGRPPSTFPPSPETFSLDNLPPFPLVPLPHSRERSSSAMGRPCLHFMGVTREIKCYLLGLYFRSNDGGTYHPFFMLKPIIDTIYNLSDPINHVYRQYRKCLIICH